VRPVRAAAPAHEAPPREHLCASCGAPVPTALELCERCAETFHRVLQPMPAAATFDASLDDDAPTLVAVRSDLDEGLHEPDVATREEPRVEFAARAVPAADVLAGFADDLDVSGTASRYDEVAVEPRPWWEAASVAVAAPPPSTTPWTGHFEAFPEQAAPADAPPADAAQEPGPTGGAKPWWELTEVEATTTTDAEASDVAGPQHAEVEARTEVAQASDDVEPAARDEDPAEPTPVVAASTAVEPGDPLPVFETQEGVSDAQPAAEPRPWWEVADFTAAAPVPAMEAPAGEPALGSEPLISARESDAVVASTDADAVSRHTQVQAHRVADVPHAPETPRRAPDAPVRPPRPRPARPSRPPARTRRASVGRLLSVAIGSALLCVVAMLGFPDLFDLTWNAPAPVSSPPSPEPLPAPLPADPGLPAGSAVPATPPPAAASTPPAAEAPKPAPAASSVSPARPKARPDAAAANRAARLLQQRAAAAQGRPGAVTPPPAEPPAELPRPAVAETPAVVVPAVEPEPVAEPLGNTFEVTQVDVRPQVTRQVTPRRPDGRTSAEVVVVRVLVSPSGRAADVRVVRGARDAPSYDDAAVAAVRQWTFSPAQKRSRPVSCWIHVGVPFAGGE
jgi:protein TonB